MKILLLLLLMVSGSVYGQDAKFIFVFLNKKEGKPVASKEEEKIVMDGHMANIRRLAKEGKLIAAGPFMDFGGIFIFNTSSLDEARGWLNTDPGVQAGRWNLEMYVYTPRVGSACSAREPIEMVSYEFIRYTTNIAKYNVQNVPEIERKHNEYLKQIEKTGNVVAEGVFGDNGGILILKGELQKEVIEADPSLQDGLYQVDFRKLYIAKGAFCEKY